MQNSAIRIVLTTIACCLLLSGCQQTQHRDDAVALHSQSNQLASLIAGTKYLKYQCNRSDIADDSALEQAAFRVAQSRNWNTRAYFNNQQPGGLKNSLIVQRSDNLYQALLADPTPKEVQCSAFNRSLSPFIAVAASVTTR